MKKEDYIFLEQQLGAHNYKPLDVVLSRGQGVWVWDVEGKKYLDCLAAYSAVNQGHCHPKILQAMIGQAKNLTLTSRAFRNDQLGLLYRELCDLTHSGVIIPPPGYLGKVRKICREHNVVLILDEIQTGLGRTGKLLAEEHDGIEADITLIGKALSGGYYPISAVLSNTELMDVLQPGEHGSTFGGNPLACAVARTALKVLMEENMIENAEKMGAYFLSGLRRILSSKIKDIRGKGLMIGVEFFEDAGGARHYCEKLQEKGILCKETHDHIIRFAPPLVITRDEVDWALERIQVVFQQ